LESKQSKTKDYLLKILRNNTMMKYRIQKKGIVVIPTHQAGMTRVKNTHKYKNEKFLEPAL